MEGPSIPAPIRVAPPQAGDASEDPSPPSRKRAREQGSEKFWALLSDHAPLAALRASDSSPWETLRRCATDPGMVSAYKRIVHD